MIPLVFDENLSTRSVEDAFSALGMYGRFGDYFTRGMSDEAILEKVGASGICLVTRDKGFYRQAKNIPAIVRYKARAIFIDKIGDKPSAEVIEVLKIAYPVCQKFAEKHPAPFSGRYSPVTRRIEVARLA